MTKLKPKWKQTFRRKLLAWYAKHERDLPWRRSSDPYRVWVSEVMLQQTQVETVKAYFQRFMKAFPTVRKLAAADEQQVLLLWEGLGYYRRARGLHAAAKVIVEEHGGKFPSDVHTLMKLPGIGRYTAGAIVSIAFDKPAPILEANTIRLFARLVGYREDPTKSAGQKVLWATAEKLLPKKNVARFNQALMELGSLVCKPAMPMCSECPAKSVCETNRLGLQAEIPASKKKQKFTDVREAAVVVRKKNQLLVRQCAEGERWAGLWDFPRFEVDAEGPLFVHKELATKVADQTGIVIGNAQLMKTLKHGVTRFRITLDCYDAEFKSGRVRSSKAKPVRWIDAKELAELPLSVTGRKIAKLVCS
ncbi:A/G-specific adenine glycosylase [Adhaeretor mobilis]|uniref:Adenine DNA glycosylase n=1 Tax=Adhaeretor mobilis TaxID=1930276 RepID=A0A517MRJ1_9BACT|nr:A/G-specific adenine glycosylase [Adhaeretor mobilis]QDS97502.1 putative A/G-specific adenine glycosylase YfhQ [Adhaeretor mobilis]